MTDSLLDPCKGHTYIHMPEVFIQSEGFIQPEVFIQTELQRAVRKDQGLVHSAGVSLVRGLEDLPPLAICLPPPL